jgi:hypothetical protein
MSHLDTMNTENTMNLDAEIDRQRALGYETFDDYITRTGFPRDEASYSAWISEGRWMLTSRDKPIRERDTSRFKDYEPEQAYGTAHDFMEHTRFGGTRDDY